MGQHKVLDPNGIENNNDNFIGNVNSIRYPGYYFDSETRMYYLQTRYYDPSTGRFINADSIDYADPESINGLNLYVYCNSNPIMRHDPSGHFSLPFSLNPLDYISVGISIVGNALEPVTDWVKDHWKELAIGAAFIIGGALITVLTCGTGTGFWIAFGSASSID